jgi:hypothetical protein
MYDVVVKGYTYYLCVLHIKSCVEHSFFARWDFLPRSRAMQTFLHIIFHVAMLFIEIRLKNPGSTFSGECIWPKHETFSTKTILCNHKNDSNK